jgi:F-type H+-transporting ATPase subunit b
VRYLAAVVVTPPSNPLIPEIPELIIGAIAFLVVFAILGRVLMPRISKTLQERTDKIEGGLERAQETQAEADRTLERYKAQLAEARHEAARLRAEAEARGAQIIAERREQAEAEYRRITEAARAQIDADRQQAFQSLRTEVGTMAVQLASKIVGESLEDEARQRRTVDRFLADLEGRSADRGARGSAAPDGGVKASR